MSIALYTITSSLHKGLVATAEDPFVVEVEKALGEDFIHCGEDFSSYGQYDKSIIYVRTGGTEGVFKALGITTDVRLLTSGRNNSLAAAMEVLSYVNMMGGRGEILHGDALYIASRINSQISTRASQKFLQKIPSVNFNGARLGVIGRPSDWLIASDVDYKKAQQELGLELVDIDINDLVKRVKLRVCDLRSFQGSVAIYEVLKDMVAEYNLSGLTIRCFDLLDTLGNTGCLALARLNAEGIVSSCEGDVPALITMMLASRISHCPGFQCNLSRISGDELLFAHCTVPLSMVKSFHYDTHFESGLGTAIKGEFEEGDVVIMKVSPRLDCMVSIPARIVRNLSEPGLCRTQVVVSAPDAAEYFLSSPLANHHIIVPLINR